jgi:hypothetical protein
MLAGDKFFFTMQGVHMHILLLEMRDRRVQWLPAFVPVL